LDNIYETGQSEYRRLQQDIDSIKLGRWS
jgi:hypothetical protein